jgi:putative ABC transport system permease protein
MLATGGGLGVLAAAWTIDAAVPLLPAGLPRVENVGLNVPVLAFSAATLLLIAVLAGIWPALEAARGGLAASVGDLSRGSTGSLRQTRLRDLLVVAQIAATLWLVVGAALLARSFGELLQVNPGFQADGVYTMHLAIPRAKYPNDRDIAAFCTRLLDRIRTVPGVVSAGLVNRLPLAGGAQTGPIEFERIDPRAALAQVDFRTVTPDYFATLRIPLHAGRTFTERDGEDAPPVAIIDERLATTFFAGVDPLGRRVRIPVADLPWLTIVGVVGHIRHDRMDEDVRPQIYFSYKQRPQDRMALAVRTLGDPQAIGPSLAAAVQAVDPEQPVYDARTLDAVVDRSLAQRWLQATVLTAFATIAVVLASIGIYGVIAFAVGQRSREFGIRLALGARRGEIVALVVRRGVLLFAAGAAIGLGATAASARIFGTMLFEVGALDLVSLAAATVLLFVVALAASGLPARRAAGVDPSVALRAE